MIVPKAMTLQKASLFFIPTPVLFVKDATA